MLDNWSWEKKVPPARARFPHRYEGFPYVSKSNTEKKFPRPDQGSPTHCYVAICLCFKIQIRKKVPPGLARFPHRYGVFLYVSESSPKSSPGPIKVPPSIVMSPCAYVSESGPAKMFSGPNEGYPMTHHVTSCHFAPRHVTWRHIASHHVMSQPLQQFVMFLFGDSVLG